jgi:hypothetical protein
MFEPRPLGLRGGIGVIDVELLSVIRAGTPRPFLDPRDIAAHWAVEEHGPQVLALLSLIRLSSTT